MTRATRLLAAALAGASLPLAFAPYGLWPLAVLAPAALLALLASCSPRAAFLTGWVFGLGMFGHGVWWIQVSVHQFGVPYYAFSITITALFVAGMALYPGLFAWALARLGEHDGPRRLVLAPALWVLIEYLRGWLFTGFPWLALGYSQIDAPLGGFAPIAGVHGVSLLVMVAAVLVTALTPAAWRWRAVLALALAGLLVAGRLAGAIEFTVAAGEERRVALIQGAVPQALKWRRELRAASIALYRELSAPHWDADVIIWPETALAAFPYEVRAVLEELGREALASDTDLLIGMPTGTPWQGEHYNSLVDLGATPGRYDKRHLVPFGEFFPFKSLLGGIASLLTIPMSDFSAGAPGAATLKVAGFEAGISICYEDAFGAEVAAAVPPAAFLVNVSNDAWFGDTIAPHQHLEIARMRALETGRYLLRGTNTGLTAVIDHRGRVLALAEPFVEAALRSRFQPRQGLTPYVRFGDGLPLALSLAVLGLGLLARRRDSQAAAAR
ncbi:MAG: apolipoprotein N-acyltransferase [Gammaproteobacteria bacterium]